MSTPGSELDAVARLARVRLDDEERARFAEQLERIVAYVRQLEGVDVEDVPPTRHLLEIVDVDREDVARSSLPAETALGAAPERLDGHFVVPLVLPSDPE